MAQQARFEIGSLPGRRRTAQAVQAGHHGRTGQRQRAHQRSVIAQPLGRAAVGVNAAR
jgi:hypothetical protein